jgi:phosphohistidine swiveling domain-containing protein
VNSPEAWPLLRTCANLLGQTLADADVIDEPEELFFLTRSELTHNQALGSAARRRRALWQRQSRLVPPLAIGSEPPLIGHHLARTLGIDRTDRHERAFLTGQPASPGRATGPARIVRGPEEFTRVQPGDVLVARSTAPAWTPLFTRVVAVVTDAGTPAAHASLIAREFGLPAVVATGNATARVSDGQRLTVDGGQGTVTLASQ